MLCVCVHSSSSLIDLHECFERLSVAVCVLSASLY